MADVNVPIELVTPAGTIRFNDYSQPEFYHLTEFTGIDFADLRTSRRDRPARHRVILGRPLKGALNPLLEGTIVFSSTRSRERMSRALRAACESIVGTSGTLRFQPPDLGGMWLRTTVYLAERVDIKGQLMKTFQIPLVAEDPTIYADVLREQYTSFVSTSLGGGLTFPVTFPLNFGDPSGDGSGVFANGPGSGGVEVYPTVKIFGTITNPTLVNSTTGDVLALTKGLVLRAPDWVEVDMLREEVRLNGSVDRPLMGMMDAQWSEFWALIPGNNSVRLMGSSPDPATARAQLVWRDGWA